VNGEVNSIMEPSGDFVVLQFALENGDLWPIALLLLDSQDRLHLRARSGVALSSRIQPEDVEVVDLFLDQLRTDAQATSGRELLTTLEDRLSNTIRISDRKQTQTGNIQNVLEHLYRQHIAVD
jgi:hypothetical protein